MQGTKNNRRQKNTVGGSISQTSGLFSKMLYFGTQINPRQILT